MTSLHFGKTGREFETASAVKQHEEESNKPLLTHTPFDSGALKQYSYSTDAQAVQTQIARTPATQYLTLNSADRNQTSTVAPFQYNRQPWNRFKLQRPQNIMNTYATRMLVSEINFPWYIPNINSLTNTIYIRFAGILYTITIGSTAFANGDQIATALVSLINSGVALIPGGSITPGAIPGSNFIVEYNTAQGQSQFVIGSLGGVCQIYYTDPGAFNAFPPSQEGAYYTSASLALLMGLDFNQVSGAVATDYIGRPTTCQYTSYIDIVSDKLHQYSTNRDGSSDNFFSRNNVCRIYLSDETSNVVMGANTSGTINIPAINEGSSLGSVNTISTTFTPFIPGVSSPFFIHRQFKNPKAVMWNKESSVDWLDIAVYDQFGNLVPLPTPVLAGENIINAVPAYPDFQITLLASEN